MRELKWESQGYSRFLEVFLIIFATQRLSVRNGSEFWFSTARRGLGKLQRDSGFSSGGKETIRRQSFCDGVEVKSDTNFKNLKKNHLSNISRIVSWFFPSKIFSWNSRLIFSIVAWWNLEKIREKGGFFFSSKCHENYSCNLRDPT